MSRARSVTAAAVLAKLRPVLPAYRPEVQRGAADQLALARDGRIELRLAAAAVAGFELCVGHVGGVRTEQREPEHLPVNDRWKSGAGELAREGSR
jgi:hypothetical protein